MAAFANTTMIRYLDFNDWYPGGHPSDTLGGLISLAGAAGVSGRRLIAAAVVSYEVFIRLQSPPSSASSGFDQGFSMGVATCAAMGNMLGLDAGHDRRGDRDNRGLRGSDPGHPVRDTVDVEGTATAYAVRNAASISWREPE